MRPGPCLRLADPASASIPYGTGLNGFTSSIVWRNRQDLGSFPVASFTGDGAYDRGDVYREVCQRHPDAAVVVPPRLSAVPSATAETAPTKRDRHLQLIAERGRMGWERASGYNWRALVEADIGRYKRVIGDALRSRTEARQMTEVAIAVASLNRMLELGRPEYLRLS